MTFSLSSRHNPHAMPAWVRRLMGESSELPRLSRAELARRRDDLARAYRRFERFVETVLDAAHAGPSHALREAYRESRQAWLKAFSPLHVYVSAYIRPDAVDYVATDEERARVDLFERLSDAETLDDWLAADDGHTPNRVSRGREALALYAEQLRLLSTVRR